MGTDVLDGVASEVSLARRIQPTYGYYRQPNGWITVSPITQWERVKYQNEGWQHLGQYGAFDMTTYVVNHPLEGLFMMGGAKEMTVDQIITSGLHLNPPLVPTCRQHLTQYHRYHDQRCWVNARPVEFPQLKDVSPELLKPFVCEFCSRKLPTKEAREQHQSVVHKELLGNVRTGDSLGKSLAEALGKTAVMPSQQPMEQRLSAVEALLAERGNGLERCGCGGTFKNGGKHFHERGSQHKAWAKVNP